MGAVHLAYSISSKSRMKKQEYTSGTSQPGVLGNQQGHFAVVVA